MYIEKYWGNYIGGSDDSLTLTAYLAGKQKEQITLNEIFSDFGADTLFGDFRNTDPPLAFTTPEGWEMGLQCAISLAADLAALLLECKVNKNFDLLELDDTLEIEPSNSRIRIAATSTEYEQINRILSDFSISPTAYDISEFETEEAIQEMAAVCKELWSELYR